jgi:GalNAc-alpha-(1->4)-GalNAc-alpha-(1->3)-diNAcBac-PP-undecaprenol alpha-1,4-N-acetyl-D-galactosaminyltransferase
MRITLVISSLWGGGAERVVSLLANGWAEEGQDVSLLTLEKEGGPEYFIHDSVEIRHLGLSHVSNHFLEGLVHNLRRIWVLRRAIRHLQPDIVVSFMDQNNVLTLLATCGFGTPVVISEHGDLLPDDIRRIWSLLRRVVYPLANMLVCPNSASLARLRTSIKVPGIVIANPVVVPPILRQGGQRAGPAGTFFLVAMGRLVRGKGFDLLLAAFSRVADRHPDWSLTIIGKGPLRSELEEQSAALKLAGRVHFAGELADPFPMLRAAHLFVFSSRSEGFGNALAEAMACGLPVVSFDCPEGPRTIIRDGIDGILVPPEDVIALAQAMDSLMADSGARARLAARAPEVILRFGQQRILFLWKHLFSQLLTARTPVLRKNSVLRREECKGSAKAAPHRQTGAI